MDKKRTKKVVSGQDRVETLFVSRDAEGRNQESAPGLPERQVSFKKHSPFIIASFGYMASSTPF
jgi:hypothetical protein